MKKEEAKWYEKASGKKQHKAENSAKFAAKNELKKQRKEHAIFSKISASLHSMRSSRRQEKTIFLKIKVQKPFQCLN